MSEPRQRVVYNLWTRDPQGKLLEKPPPTGSRTENNIIWGHTLDDFYWIPRIPGVNLLTIWSRSMIKEYGENFLNLEHEEEPEPRRLRPWPVLTLPEDAASSASICRIDEGCSGKHENCAVRVEEVTTKPATRTDVKCPSLAGLECCSVMYCPPEPPKQHATCDIQSADVSSSSESSTETEAPLDHLDPSPSADGTMTPSTLAQGRPTSSCLPPCRLHALLVSSSDPPPAQKPPSDIAATAQADPQNELHNTNEGLQIERDGTPTPDTDIATATQQQLALPHLDTSPFTVDSVSPLDGDGSSTPLSATLVSMSPTGEVMKTKSTSWSLDSPEWLEAKMVLAETTELAEVVEVVPVEHESVDGVSTQDSVSPVHAAKVIHDVIGADASEVQACTLEEAENLGAEGTSAIDAPIPAKEEPAAAEVIVADAVVVEDGPKEEVGCNEKTSGANNEATAEEDGPGSSQTTQATSDDITPDVTDQSAQPVEATPPALSTDTAAPNHPQAATEAEKERLTVGMNEDSQTGGVDNVSTQSSTEDPVASVPTEKEGSKTAPLPPPPKLEEFIPEDYFPDILYVNDPENKTAIASSYYSSRTNAKTPSVERVPRKYKRIPVSSSSPASSHSSSPGVPKPETNLRIAYLNLSCAPTLGTGNHSAVFRANLRLPQPLSARSSTGEVTVAAKTGYPGDQARELLSNEGKIYSGFPKHLQEDWCGYNLVAPIAHPVPVGAVVPKFYGYYVPVMEDVEREKQETVRVWMETEKVKRKERKEANRAKAKEARRKKRADEKKAAAEVKTAQAAKAEGEEVSKAEDKASGSDGENNASEGQQSENDVAAEATVPAEDAQTSKGEAKDDGDGGQADVGAVTEEAESDHEDDQVEDSDDDAKYDEDEELIALQYFQISASYKAWHRQSPILLLEECGNPIKPEKFTPDERSECYSLALRLHHAEFTQNSFYVRNILRQPGPLTAPPSERSDKTPSFRIIDHGRGEHWQHKLEDLNEKNAKKWLQVQKARDWHTMNVPTENDMKRRVTARAAQDKDEKQQLEEARKSWWESRDYEIRKAHSELQVSDFDY
ncbi:hypothetical protein R3P38DRAFT_3559692 [Favolaschia claudopus]|uniref:Uncharacterized protein n=1 Tax=Favolaschia claudopus TaxID=2862362 RepID=A0AAW0AVU4_9AGAR